MPAVEQATEDPVVQVVAAAPIATITITITTLSIIDDPQWRSTPILECRGQP